ncbi:methyl-accepting chemotaxis protein [Clostridium acetobutylicum]|uniref:Methyl-accepting chemotaxis protein n=4 Tax=Clostridium acetobutylicum TaxID=1488 RepID=Q97MU0_CLOAB|nr:MULTISPECIES: methyl-accepting chemotaxis protein [Clostridium]AAK78086.1 Methyl-accepting chemotaxis protein [Clostridium acetobutylicum ATCC 824]AEI31061.1 methyl-accepting chemotaxis protein [Clostridium acetobutylicum DSM 1731]AWV81851.1 methyl-accepting chemotaxis protein [Clostridium acetobutylicum]MBC2395399.1 methyl-accepting chemotaxis protein [Clostridium acetobutylicum]MBC2586382.1 methyl-accepting chemotaxis protein [Clostridium acetobutylicum]
MRRDSMGFIRNFTIRSKLLSLLLINVLLIVIVVLFMIEIRAEYSKKRGDINSVYCYNEKVINSLKDDLGISQDYIVQYVYDRNTHEYSKVELDRRIDKVKHLDNYKGLINKIGTGINEYNSVLTKIQNYGDNDNQYELKAQLNKNKDIRADIIDSLDRLMDENINQEYIEENKLIDKYLEFSIVTVLIAFFVITLIASFVFYDIHGMLNKILNVIDRIFQSEAVDMEYKMSRKDELGVILNKVVDFGNQLDNIIKNILLKSQRDENENRVKNSSKEGFETPGEVYRIIEDSYKNINTLVSRAYAQSMKVSKEIKEFSIISDKIRLFTEKSYNSVNNIREIIDKLQDKFEDAIYNGKCLVKEINSTNSYEIDILEIDKNKYVSNFNKLFEVLYDVDYIFFRVKDIIDDERKVYKSIEEIPKDILLCSNMLTEDLKDTIMDMKELTAISQGQLVLVERLNKLLKNE